MSVVFYVCGGLCIFKTNMLVAWGQRSYAKRKFVQSSPLSSGKPAAANSPPKNVRASARKAVQARWLRIGPFP